MSHPRVELKCQLETGVSKPEYASRLESGMDLRAWLKKEISLSAGDRILIKTGLRVAVPTGYELQVRSRSGLTLKHGIIVLNAPGTIDSSYRGDVGVILANMSGEDFTITPGMRIAQAVLCPVVQAELVPVHSLDSTIRNEGGFGSTGFNIFSI